MIWPPASSSSSPSCGASEPGYSLEKRLGPQGWLAGLDRPGRLAPTRPGGRRPLKSSPSCKISPNASLAGGGIEPGQRPRRVGVAAAPTSASGKTTCPTAIYRHRRVSYVNIWGRLGYGRPPDSATPYEGLGPDPRKRIAPWWKRPFAGARPGRPVSTTSEFGAAIRTVPTAGRSHRALPCDAEEARLVSWGGSVDITDRKRAGGSAARRRGAGSAARSRTPRSASPTRTPKASSCARQREVLRHRRLPPRGEVLERPGVTSPHPERPGGEPRRVGGGRREGRVARLAAGKAVPPPRTARSSGWSWSSRSSGTRRSAPVTFSSRLSMVFATQAAGGGRLKASGGSGRSWTMPPTPSSLLDDQLVVVDVGSARRARASAHARRVV